MIFYKKIFAWMIAKNSLKYNRLTQDRKKNLFKDISGAVVEIGAGTGANLPFLPTTVNYSALEPSKEMIPYLEKALKKHSFSNFKIINDSAENILIPNESVDFVISTLTLCSVENPEKVIGEIYRILKPGGRFLFIEHIAAPKKTILRALQHYLVWIWRMCGEGCSLDRETDLIIEKADFKDIQMEKFKLPVTFFVSPHMIGTATK